MNGKPLPSGSDNLTQQNLSLLTGLFTSKDTSPLEATSLWVEQAQKATRRSDRVTLTLLQNTLKLAVFPLPTLLQIEAGFYEGRMYEISRDFGPAEQCYRRGLAMLDTANLLEADQVGLRTRFAVRLGISLAGSLQVDPAEELIRGALPVIQERMDYELGSQAYYGLGIIYYFRGDLDASINFARQGLVMAQTCRDTQGIANLTNNLGVYYLTRGELEAALEMLEESIRVRKESGEQRTSGPTYINLGVINYRLKKYQQALDNYNVALVIYQSLNDRPSIALIHGNMVGVLNAMGRYREGLEHAQQSIRLFRENENGLSLAWSLGLGASSAQSLGQSGVAREYLAEASRVLADYTGNEDNAADVAEIYLELGKAWTAVASGEEERLTAVDYFRQALAKYEQVRNQLEIISTLQHLADTLAQVPGMELEALNVYRRWWELAAIRYPNEEMRLHLGTMFRYAQLLSGAGLRLESLAVYRSALAFCSPENAGPEEKLKLGQHYHVASLLAPPPETLDLLEQAIKYYRESNLYPPAELKRLSNHLANLKKQARKR